MHERGAPHMIDPSRLLDSAQRLYGDDMERLWGEMMPVPERNLRVAQRRRATVRRRRSRSPTRPATPRTTSPTCTTAPRSSATSGGVRIPPAPFTIPPTPPPDIDVEAWHESIALIARVAARAAGDDALRRQRRRRRPARLSSIARLDEWAQLARDGEREQFVASRAGARSCVKAGRVDRRPTSRRRRPSSSTPGYERYWSKRRRWPSVGLDGSRLPAARAAVCWLDVADGRVAASPGTGQRARGSWRVVVLNDDHNTFDHVAETLAGVIPG